MNKLTQTRSRWKRSWVKPALLSYLLATLPVGAQVVNDGATNTLNGTTTNIVGDVTVGTNGSFTLLILTSNALLTNSGHGYLGRNAGANANTVRLTGANTRWLLGGDLYGGFSGSGNGLVISNGARVGNSQGFLGFNPSSGNNLALVSGAGSLWMNGSALNVGYSGAGNQLVVSNGALVGNDAGFLGAFASSSNNAAVVTGAGSRWTNKAGLFVGYNGAGNQLVVSGGGVVRSSIGEVGFTGSSDNNAVLVTGAGSQWTNDGSLNVGNLGAGNQLVVSNGAVVQNLFGYVGFNSTSSSNAVVVTGAGSRWANEARSSPGETEARLYVGYEGAGNQMVVSNGGLVENDFGYLGARASSTNNTAVVTGIGSLWRNALELFVGSNGDGNQLVVSDGGVVRNRSGYLGYHSSNNVAVVTGAGSRWTNEDDLYVGDFDSGNLLVVSNGGLVVSDFGYLSTSGGSSNNAAVVTGAGSQWTNAGGLFVGAFGAGNQLVVSDGGVVRNREGYLGFDSLSPNNTAVVTGMGSLWRNESDLAVGYDGAGNQLVVTNGGLVRNRGGYVGFDSSYNVAVVTGAGSRWTNELDLTVGHNQFDLFGDDDVAGNQLVVTNGGVVQNRAGIIGSNGSNEDIMNNSVLVTGAGSVWANSSSLIIGSNGALNQLVVSAGGAVQNTTGTIGSHADAINNSVLVTGAGSLWTNSGSLLIGSNGGFNQLIVSAGGMVRAAGSVTVGASATATNNSVLAMGGSLASVGLTLGNAVSRNNSVTLLSGSTWDVGGGPFTWGNAGSNDTLTIDATSSLTNIGGLTLDENQTAFHLTNAPGGYTLNGFTTNQLQFKPTGLGAVIVGNDGPNVQLTISNSKIAGTTGTIGNNATALSNLILVAGAGSVWSNSSSLNIGNNGSFNQLVVSNGGAVRAVGLVTLGNATGSTNNRVLAVGGSLASVGLTLGNAVSRNNSVTLLSGSIWDAGGGTFTWGNAGSNDTLTIDATSGLTNIGALTLDENATAFYLTNAPGGYSLNGFTASQLQFKPTGLGAVIVGNDGANVQLTIGNYALSDTNGTVGNNASAISNSVFVTGAGSRWTNRGALTIGNRGAFNQLVLSNAATVFASSNVVVGFNSSASNNFLLLSTGALLTNGGNGVLGLNPGANANTASVSDANSRWLMGGDLYVGSNSAFNQFVISNAAAVTAGGGVFVGANASASNNLLLLSAGAQLTNGGNVVLGMSAGANSNTVSVSGANSRWHMAAYSILYVGNSGAFNRLVISNGAQMGYHFGNPAYIGYNSSAINNEVLVTGANSRWFMGGDLYVGLFCSGSQLVISDGARVENGTGFIGPANSTPPSPVSNNVALVTGANSTWFNGSGLFVGNAGSGWLVISNGALVWAHTGFIGGYYGNNNGAVVTGINSRWTNSNALWVSQGGSGCSLVISNGGWVDDYDGIIGYLTTANTNEVVVTGAGSVWNNRNELQVGSDGYGNRLLIANGGTVFVGNRVYVGFGFYPYTSNNLVTVSGGSLIVTNPVGSGLLDIRRGTNVLNAGLIEANRLVLTNASEQGGGFFSFNGGMLKTKTTTNSNGRLFAVGNGTSTATFELIGNGLHTFTDGLAISNNASLRGNGTINGTLTVAIGGTLSPGTSVGKIVLSNAPVLLGNVIMEISRNGGVLTNDQLQVAGALTYGSSLTVTNIGPGALTAGNSFQLFSASSYGGAFATLSLPGLDAGLAWTNKLLVNGSIEIIGAVLPKIATISVSGTNVIITGTNGTPNAPYAVLTSTNVALPLSNWTSIATNLFGPLGEFSFTNGIAPGIPQRFFRLRSP